MLRRISRVAGAIARRLTSDRGALAVGLGAVVLYAPAAFWGLPHATSEITVRGWDVDGIAGMNVLSELHNLAVQPKPDWYTAYPVLHYVVLGLVYAPYLAYLFVTCQSSGPAFEYPFGFCEPVTAFRTLGAIARVVTVLMAAGTVMMAYWTARALWDRRSAILGAAALACTVPMVYYGRTSNLDVPALFWTSIALLIAVRSAMIGLTLRRAVLLGVAAAFAVATKDQAYGALVPSLVAVAVLELRRRLPASAQEPGTRQPWRAVAALVGSGAVAYALANAIIIRPGRFASHVRFVTGYADSFFNVQHPTWITVLRPATPAGFLQLLGDLVAATVTGMGPVIPVVGLIGLAAWWRGAPAARILTWSLLGFVVLTLFPVRHMQYRYILPVAYPLALFAGAALAWATRRGPVVAATAWLTAAAGLAVPLARSTDLTHQMMFDARYAAGEWIAASLSPGDSIGFFGIRHKLPALPEGVGAVQLREDDAVTTARLAAGRPGYLLVAPDYFSTEDRERSTMFPDDLYRQLLDGTLGYRRVATFKTEPLLGYPLPYLPYVNPQVRIFRYSGASGLAAP